MNQNRLGNSDLFVGEIGFGCMSLPRDTKKATDILLSAYEYGVNFFDTADLYGRGENEIIVGQALRAHRTNVIIATKVGNRWTEGAEGWTWDASSAYIKQAVRASLRRLGMDYIDLYQLHGGTLEDDIDEVIATFEDLKTEGLIRHYGISSIRPNVIREYVHRSNIVSVMMQYSILDRRPEEAILDLLNHHGVSAITRGALAQGILSEKTLKRTSHDTGFLDYTGSELYDTVSRLNSLSSESRTLQHIALRYPLQHPAVATTVPGASTLSQVQENSAASTVGKFTEEEMTLIQGCSKPNLYTVHR